MGRLSRIGGAILGTAVALNAGDSHGQSGPDQQNPPEYNSLTEVPTLMRALQGKDIIINPPFRPVSGSLSDLSPAILEKAFFISPAYNYTDAAQAMEQHYDLNLLIQTGANYVDYDVFSYAGEDANGQLYKWVIDAKHCTRPKGTYTGYYTINNVRFYTVGPSDDDFICPAEVLKLITDTADQTQVVLEVPKETPKPVTALEYVPHAGKFADVEPSLVQNGIFLVPILTLDASEEVPAELDSAAYTTHSTHGGAKRTVYREYALESYVPETGVLKVSDTGDASKCMETRTFKDQIIGTKTSYLLSEPGSSEMKDVACKKESPAATTVKAKSPWKLPVRAGLSLGADVEETSEYSLGNAPAAHVSVQAQPFAFPLELGLSGDFIFTGEGSGLEGIDLMVGGRPFKKVPVGVYLTIGDSFEARDRYKETTLNGAFSYGAKVDGDVYKFNLADDRALAVNCHATAQQHLYGGGGFSVWNVGGGCGLVWDTVVSGEGGEERELVVEAEPKEAHLKMKTKPYSYELADFRETKDEVKKAELVRLSEEMQKRALDNKWEAVELRYDDATKLGILLSYRDYKHGAEAARAAGNMEECYERLLLAQTVAVSELDKQEAIQWIADIEANFSRVEIVIKADGVVTLEVSQMPFAPDQRAAITFAQTEVADGTFEGLIPLILNLDGTQGTYVLNGQTIKISDLRPLSTKTTTEIRLEK